MVLGEAFVKFVCTKCLWSTLQVCGFNVNSFLQAEHLDCGLFDIVNVFVLCLFRKPEISSSESESEQPLLPKNR